MDTAEGIDEIIRHNRYERAKFLRITLQESDAILQPIDFGSLQSNSEGFTRNINSRHQRSCSREVDSISPYATADFQYSFPLPL